MVISVIQISDNLIRTIKTKIEKNKKNFFKKNPPVTRQHIFVVQITIFKLTFVFLFALKAFTVFNGFRILAAYRVFRAFRAHNVVVRGLAVSFQVLKVMPKVVENGNPSDVDGKGNNVI